jgi:phage terminase large subunit-like protein
MGLRGIQPSSPFTKTFHVPDKPKGKTRADRLINWIKHLPITSGTKAGHLVDIPKWQEKDIRPIYRTDKKGKRIVRQALLTMPRKNGKTQTAAMLALAHLCGPEAEQRGQIYSAAADRKQAALIYDEMKAIVLATDLKDRVIIRDFNKHLEDKKTGSVYFALSADADTKHGFSASFVVYDELAQAPNRKLYDVLTTSTAARAEPLIIVISTQSPDEHSVMTELVNYGLDIQSGVHNDPAFYPVIYSAPEDADPWDEKVWAKCNPALGDFRSLDEMRSAAQQAQRIPVREATFRLLYLNQRINADARFIAMPEWDACAGKVDLASLKGRRCYAGLDLATTTDIAALNLIFPPLVREDPFISLSFFWVPEENIEDRVKKDRVPYDLWVNQGWIEATPGNLIDYRWIMLKLGQCRIDYDLKMLAFDRWGSQKIVTDLCDEIGFTVDEKEAARSNKPLLCQFGQGFASMSSPTKELLNMIIGRKINHGGNPVLRWMASNAVAIQDSAANMKLDKSKSIERIDGIVALIMALDLAIRNANQTGGSIYDERDMRIL